MPVPQNWRVDPFSGAQQYVSVVAEPHIIPANSPFYVWLNEVPANDGLLVARLASIQQILQPNSASGQNSFIYEAAPATNYNGNTGLQAGTNGTVGTPATPARTRLLVQFNLATLPITAQKAQLWLYLGTATGATPQTYNLYQVTGLWAPGTLTWNSAPTYNLIALSQTQVAGPGWYVWDLTTLYNNWQAGSSQNFGLMLAANDETLSNSYAIFNSASAAANQPKLVLTVPQTTFTQVAQTVVPSQGQVAINYAEGVLRLNPSDANKAIEIDYTATGSNISSRDVGDINRLVGAGQDGDLNVMSGVYTLSGTQKHFGNVYIAPGATLAIPGPDPVSIGCTNFSCYGTINIAGSGYLGGAGGASNGSGQPGQGPGGGGGGVFAIGGDTMIGAIMGSLIANGFTNSVLGGYGLSQGSNLALAMQGIYFTTAGQQSAFAAWWNAGGWNAATDPYLSHVHQVAAYLATPSAGGGGGGNHVAGTAATGPGGGGGGAMNPIRDTNISYFVIPPAGGGGGGAAGNPGGAGGNGGGGLLVQATGSIYVDGGATVNASGNAGASPNGGGGAGGWIWLRCQRRTVLVTPSVSGGAGNGAGGAGAAGWTVFEDL